MTNLFAAKLSAIQGIDPASLPPDLLEALLEDYRRTLRADLLAYGKHVLAPLGYEPARHHKLIADELQAVADGRTDRLMLCLPPGSAKSTWASVIFPAWAMARKRMLDVIAASHTMGLAEAFGRRTRDSIAEHGPVLGAALQGDNSAAGAWRLANGSRYFAVGVGGSVTGRRSDITVIDDPVASREAADSERMRDKCWEWYNADLLTRLKPGGRVVLVMTRWHADDLAGRLLETEAARWRVLKMPAIAESSENDPLCRLPGEPLWGDGSYGYGVELMRKRDEHRAKGMMRDWESLYQQNPTPGDGTLFKTALLGTVDALPAGCKLVRAWDLAATKKLGTRDPDWTVGALLAKTPDGAWVIVDMVRLRGAPEEVEATILATAQRDGRGVRISLPQDPGQAGKSQVLYLTKKLAGWRVDSSPETGDKMTRAAPFASQVNVGNVALLRGAWNRPLIEELGGFPAATHDDQVDALARAFAALMAPPEPARAIRFPFMGR